MGLYPGGRISGIIYSLANGWAYIRGTKTGGALKWDFTVFLRTIVAKATRTVIIIRNP